jgi:hypothetical protein
MKKAALAILLCTVYVLGFGQSRFSLPFSSSYDEDAILLMGIQYNYVNQNYQLKLKEDWQRNKIIYPGPGENIHNVDNVSSINSHNSHGFSVSIPLDLRVNPNVYFAFSPSFLFINNSGIDYVGSNQTMRRRMRHLKDTQTGTNFNAFEFPLSIKYRSDEKTLKNKFNRYRVYVLGGLRYTRFIGINKEYDGLVRELQNSTIPQSLIMKSEYPSWEVGIGADIFFPYFKVSPEIRFNQSFGSVLDKDHHLAQSNKFMEPIDKALIRNIYVSLIFQ